MVVIMSAPGGEGLEERRAEQGDDAEADQGDAARDEQSDRDKEHPDEKEGSGWGVHSGPGFLRVVVEGDGRFSIGERPWPGDGPATGRMSCQVQVLNVHAACRLEAPFRAAGRAVWAFLGVVASPP
jgi:hypothetical protein